MARGNPLIALRLTREQIEALKEAARKEGITVSDVVRKALEMYLGKNA